MFVEPEPETLELIVPPVSWRPLEAELEIPSEVEMESDMVKEPAEMETDFWETEAAEVEPEEMERSPRESEILIRLLEPEREREPELEILAPLTFWR